MLHHYVHYLLIFHCVKCVRIRSFSSPNTENTDQKDSKYRHFLGSVYAKHTTFLYCISLWCKTYSILIKRGTIYSLLKSLDIRKFWKDVFLQQTFDNYLSWLKINSFLKEAPVISKRIPCFAMQINGLVSIW